MRGDARDGLLASTFATLTLFVLAGPIIAGLLGVLLPAFGHLPAIGRFGPSLQPWRDLLAMPWVVRSASMSLTAGLVTGGYDCKLIWWDLEKRTQVRSVDAHKKWIRGVFAAGRTAVYLRKC